MRRALGELDQNTPIANRRSSRQCSARACDETPVRTRDAADGQGGTPTSVRRQNAAALNAAGRSCAKIGLLIILETRKTT